MINPHLTYYNIKEGVEAFSSTRHGGFGRGNYGEFNINPYCGDEPEAVEKNLRGLAAELKIGIGQIILPHQVHKTVVKKIDKGFLSLPRERQRAELEGVDGLMTDLRRVCIGVSTADCIPILLAAKGCSAVCALHSGWRGTLMDIAAKGVEMMSREYGCEPSEMLCVIGPGISLDAFEVGEEVYEAFFDAGFDMRRIAKRREKWHIDLPLCCREELVGAGVKRQNIHLTGICTYANADDYFSARRLGTASGRIFSAIMNK